MLGYGIGIQYFGSKGGVSDIADGGLLSSTFLSRYGPYGMVMDFTDASITIDDSTDVLDYSSQGTVSPTTGALLGPGSKLTNSAPSLKFTEQADGYIAGQAHNLALYSEDFTNAAWVVANCTKSGTAEVTITLSAGTAGKYLGQTIAVVSGAPYNYSFEAKAGTHSIIQVANNGDTNAYVNFNLSTGAVGTAGSAAAGTITDVGSGYYRCSVTWTSASLGNSQRVYAVDSTSSAYGASTASTGTFVFRKGHFRRTPSVSTYVATTSASVFDLPYVYSSGVKTGIFPEPAATNLCLYARNLTNAAWVKTSASAALTATGVDGVANSASTLTASSTNGVALQNITASSAAYSGAISLKRRTGTGAVTIAVGETTGSELVTNGTFTTDMTGWTNVSCTSAAVSGEAEITADGSGQARISQNISVTAGKIYRAEATMRRGTSSVGVNILITGITQSQTITATSNTVAAVQWSAASTGIQTVRFGTVAATTAGQTCYVDSITIKEVAETTVDLSSGGWVRASILNKTLTDPCVAVKLATSGDAVDVDIAQTETGTVATSPIITYGAAVTRAVDTDTSLLNLFPSLGSAYTMYIRYKPASAAVATTGLRLDDTTANELVSIGNNASGQGIVTVTDGGVPDSTTSGTITSSAFHRIAVSVEANNVLLVVNGGAAAQDTGVTLPTLTRMLLGNTSGQLVTQIALFPGARTEAQLQAIGA